MQTLILNGWAASVHAWDLCAFAKGSDVRMLSYIEQLDGGAERTLDEMGSAVVVGWSMGGSSALRLACSRPEMIKGLVLVAATARMMAADGWSGMSERRLRAFEAGLKLTRGAGLFGLPEGRPNPYEMDSDENLERGLAYLRETDIRADLLKLRSSGRVNFPVWIFQSEKDGIVRPENAAFLAGVFTGSHVEIVPGSEHALPVFIPDRIDAAVASMT